MLVGKLYSLLRLIVFSSIIEFKDNKGTISLLQIKDWINELSIKIIVKIITLRVNREINKIFIDIVNISLDANDVT